MVTTVKPSIDVAILIIMDKGFLQLKDLRAKLLAEKVAILIIMDKGFLLLGYLEEVEVDESRNPYYNG